MAALKMPWPLLVKLTAPADVAAVPGEVSLTVAVHLASTGSSCRQVRAVPVACSVTARVVWPLLAAWLPSPP